MQTSRTSLGWVGLGEYGRRFSVGPFQCRSNKRKHPHHAKAARTTHSDKIPRAGSTSSTGGALHIYGKGVRLALAYWKWFEIVSSRFIPVRTTKQQHAARCTTRFKSANRIFFYLMHVHVLWVTLRTVFRSTLLCWWYNVAQAASLIGSKWVERGGFWFFFKFP